MQKKCVKCKELKELDQFNIDTTRSFGRQSWCKQCKNEQIREKRRTPDGRKKHNLENAQYIRTPKGKATRKTITVRFRARHPDRRSANIAVMNAVHSGKIPRISTQKCAICRGMAQEYHHFSYEEAEWLNVKPLCKNCHNSLHRN